MALSGLRGQPDPHPARAVLLDSARRYRCRGHLVYDRHSGQLLAGSLMDYGLPRADEVCSFEMDENPVPTKTNPLGVKGAGEAGNVGALAAIMNAVVDALSPLGITHIDMPATPEKVWRAIRAAPSGVSGSPSM